MWILIKFGKKTLKAYSYSIKVNGLNLIRAKIEETKIIKDIQTIIKLSLGHRENVTWNNEDVTKNPLFEKNYQRYLSLKEKIKL